MSPDISPSIPVVGQPNSTEEPKLVTALTQLVAAVNDVDSAQLAVAVAQALIPTGSILATARSAADVGYLLCDGAAVSRATYANLFTAIGTVYGAGDGSTSFNLPDLQGRVPVGKGTHADVSALNANDGQVVGNRRPKHAHTVSDPGHTHLFDRPTAFSVAPGASGGTQNSGTSTATSPATTGIAVGSSNGSVDTPSFVVVNFQIKS